MALRTLKSDADAAYRANKDGPARLAHLCADAGIPLIHISTDYVFDGTKPEPYIETDAVAPQGVYGASKLAGDLAIQAVGGPHLIARTSWVYAASGANFLRTIARLAGERKELRIVADQIGAPTTANTIASTVAGIVKLNASNLEELFARSGGMVNLACAGETSWYGFACAIVAGLKSRGVSDLAGKING